MRVGDRVADRCYFIGKPVTKSIANAPARSAGVRAVERVDDDANRSGEPGPARQPNGVGQVVVEYIGRFLFEPMVESNPTARIGKAFAHFEGQERDAGGGKVGRAIASGARERDNADAPASLFQTFGQQHDLAFCAANSIEAGNDEGNVVHCGRSRMVASIRFS